MFNNNSTPGLCEVSAPKTKSVQFKKAMKVRGLVGETRDGMADIRNNLHGGATTKSATTGGTLDPRKGSSAMRKYKV